MKKAISLLLTLVGILLAIPEMAGACKCPKSTPQKDIEWADAIYVGRVTSTRLHDDLTSYSANFEVMRVWKGPQNPLASVKTGTCVPCGLDFHTGMIYLVLSKDGGAGLCSGTRLAGQAEEMIEVLGEPKWTNDKARPLILYDGHLGPKAIDKLLQSSEKK
jgi:hypothetical protein